LFTADNILRPSSKNRRPEIYSKDILPLTYKAQEVNKKSSFAPEIFKGLFSKFKKGT
jgi:hypothetical protein